MCMQKFVRTFDSVHAHYNNTEGTAKNILLHCIAIQKHRNTYQLHALGNLREHPVDMVGCIRDAFIIIRLIQHIIQEGRKREFDGLAELRRNLGYI